MPVPVQYTYVYRGTYTGRSTMIPSFLGGEPRIEARRLWFVLLPEHSCYSWWASPGCVSAAWGTQGGKAPANWAGVLVWAGFQTCSSLDSAALALASTMYYVPPARRLCIPISLSISTINFNYLLLRSLGRRPIFQI